MIHARETDRLHIDLSRAVGGVASTRARMMRWVGRALVPIALLWTTGHTCLMAVLFDSSPD